LEIWLRLFFKVFFTQKCIKIIFFLFFKNYFLYQYIKMIWKYQKHIIIFYISISKWSENTKNILIWGKENMCFTTHIVSFFIGHQHGNKGTSYEYSNAALQRKEKRKTNIGNIYFNICSKFLFFKGLKKKWIIFWKNSFIQIMFLYKTNNKEWYEYKFYSKLYLTFNLVIFFYKYFYLNSSFLLYVTKMLKI
jgi:hypothetical protein